MSTNLNSQDLLEAQGNGPAHGRAGSFLIEISTGDDSVVKAHLSQLVSEAHSAAQGARTRDGQFFLEVQVIRPPNPITQVLVEPQVSSVSHARLSAYNAEALSVAGNARVYVSSLSAEVLGWRVGRKADWSQYVSEAQGGTAHAFKLPQMVLEILVSIQPQPLRLSQFVLEAQWILPQDCFMSALVVFICKADAGIDFTAPAISDTTIAHPSLGTVTFDDPVSGVIT